MGKKNRRKRYVTDKSELENACPLCGAKTWECGGTRNGEVGKWHICVNNNCPYDQFETASGEFCVSSFGGNGHKDKPATTSTDLTSAYTGYTGTYYQAAVRQCNHWRDKVKVGEHKVTVSAYSDRPKVKDAKLPDLGVYLAMGWQDEMSPIWGAGIKTPHREGGFPTVYCRWPDFGIVHVSVVEWLINAIISNMEKGYKIDIGCQGAHGRTGTLLACLIAKVEGLCADDAIKAVHNRHCSKAVETNSQENLIREFLGEELKVFKPDVQWRLYLGNYPRLSCSTYGVRR